MTEYGLVLSVISVSIILSVVTLREEILSMFTKVVADLTKGNELINS
ncbi:Flp family type IVb pilin [Rossellomorea aquimaris]